MSTFETLRQYLGARRRWGSLSGAALERHQDTRARALVRWVAAHSSFYRDHWAGHDLERWRELPPVDKQRMMANFDAFNTRGITRDTAFALALRAEREREFAPTIGDVTVGLSSGTSGHRGLFLVSPLEQAGWAGVILARALPRVRLSGERVAFFLRSNSNLYERVRRGRWLQFRYFDLMMPLADAVKALEDFNPTIIVAPPSMLEMLARERIAGRLHVRPDHLISVAEVLEPQDRTRLEAAFACTVGQIYQATEGLLGVTCRCGSLHLQEDIVAMQLEPAAAPDVLEPTPVAEKRFTPIITDLWRRTQPIIRYRLNDVLRVSGQSCACGSGWRVIDAIEGRQEDVLEFEEPSGRLRPFFPDTIRRAILLSSPRILEYEAVQEHPGQLRVHLEVEPGFEREAETSLRASVLEMGARHGCRPVACEVVIGLPERPTNIKRRRVRRATRSSSSQGVDDR